MEGIVSNFTNDNMFEKTSISCFNETYNLTGIVTIPNFISHKILQEIKNETENYPWWRYAILPDKNNWTVKYDDNISPENIFECLHNLTSKNFCYRFRRSISDHWGTCQCIACRLRNTVKSDEVTGVLCKIVGANKLSLGESFLSDYGRDDFLSLHHDGNKGDISVTFSLTHDWDPTFGGILQFCDENKNIYKSIVPSLGSVNIFKLNPNNGLAHFVSCVNVDKHRYTYTAWYNIIG